MRKIGLFAAMILISILRCASTAQPLPNQWDLAREKIKIHRFSTPIPANEVRDKVSSEQGIDAAIDFCKRTGITKIYLEEYRDRYEAKRQMIEHARDRFRAEGLEVSGYVTTTLIGKSSKGWTGISCYTNQGTQEQVQAIFEYAASMFDEVMIDDFLSPIACAMNAKQPSRPGR
jgi:hypothetical protein